MNSRVNTAIDRVRTARRRLRHLTRRYRRAVTRRSRQVRRALFRRRRSLERSVRRYRKKLRRRYILPLKRDLRSARRLRRKAIWSTPLRADVRTLLKWGGRASRPRVALRNYFNHPAWWMYRTHPPLRFAPSPMAELDHWVDMIPEHNPRNGIVDASRRSQRRAARPHVLEVEHWSVLTGGKGDQYYWELAAARRRRASARVRRSECRAVVTLSPGLVEHFRQFLSPDVWPKIDYVFPAFPAQRQVERPAEQPFTLVIIGNRWFDKGIPEALEAFQVLRGRYGRRVRMVVVSGHVPRGWRLPEGATLWHSFRMSSELKARLYRTADVVLIPAFTETLFNYVEAAAFGVPTVVTRLHHGDAFVREGESGYSIESPVWAYNEDYGTRWRTREHFRAEVQRMREAGQLAPVVEGIVDRVALMVSGEVDLKLLRDGARRLHAERFSPEVRNAKLRAIYARALE